MNNNKEPRFNYTGYGWEGNKYNPDLGIVDIAKLIRKQLKEKYADCKFSVTVQQYSGGQSLRLQLMSAPFEVWEKPSDTDSAEQKTRKEQTIKCGNTGVNHYYIEQAYELTAKAREVMSFAKGLANSFNFNDSDGQIDYFHTNFYLHLAVGRWDKPFVRTSSNQQVAEHLESVVHV